MPGIYTPTGDYIEFADQPRREDLLGETATAAAVGELDVAGFLASLPDPDPVLRKRGDDAAVLEDLTADDQVCMAMQARKLRVLNQRDYDFKPGLKPGQDATPEAARLCDELTADLEDIRLLDVFSDLMDAPFFGASFLELMWEPRDGKYRLAGIVGKPREWFTWDKDRRPCLRMVHGLEPKPLPWGKFLIGRHFPTYKNPYGLRLLSRCLWPVAFKRGGTKFFTRFLDRFGQPWTLGKAPQGADKAQKLAMAQDLAAMVQDAVAVIPHGAEVSLVESKGAAGSQFDAYLDRWDKAISKVLMGQTLTSELDGQGSRAAAQVHLDVAGDIADADQFLVETALNDLAVIYRDINAPGVDAPVFGFNEPEDHGAQADLDTKLYAVGVRFTAGHFERHYGLNPDEFTLDGAEPAAPEGQAEPAGPVSAFAEGDGDGGHQHLLDQLVENLLPRAARQNDAFMDKLLALIGKAESFEEIQLLLAEHLGQDLDLKEQEDLLADLLTAAALLGRDAARADG
ncbi:MAG: DUF935 domain-containing protein [Deltaproteobacteria bacterium]|nr:DUF935 domain-containing protein [Deltaproteobacteria bacterium]